MAGKERRPGWLMTPGNQSGYLYLFGRKSLACNFCAGNSDFSADLGGC